MNMRLPGSCSTVVLPLQPPDLMVHLVQVSVPIYSLAAWILLVQPSKDIKWYFSQIQVQVKVKKSFLTNWTNLFAKFFLVVINMRFSAYLAVLENSHLPVYIGTRTLGHKGQWCPDWEWVWVNFQNCKSLVTVEFFPLQKTFWEDSKVEKFVSKLLF